MSASARDEILRRVRAGLGSAARADDAEREWLQIRREYRREVSGSKSEILQLFEDRLRDYDARVIRCTHSAIAAEVGGLLRDRAKSKMVAPAGFPFPLPEGCEFLIEEGGRILSASELEGAGGIMTGATLAIAETGTIVLQRVPGQGRRVLTLIPDYHLCVLRSADVVGTVPEALARLHATATLPTTFISGPSATADIEMTRIKGVHGPRFLDVVIVTD